MSHHCRPIAARSLGYDPALAYLKEHVHLPANYSMGDAQPMRALLSTEIEGVRVRGTTDIVITESKKNLEATTRGSIGRSLILWTRRALLYKPGLDVAEGRLGTIGLLQTGSFTPSALWTKIRQDLMGVWSVGAGFWTTMDIVSYSLIPRFGFRSL
eukprot:scaffold45987_cov32-Attheya_sp.AAC.1